MVYDGLHWMTVGAAMIYMLEMSNECLLVVCLGFAMVWCCNVMYANRWYA